MSGGRGKGPLAGVRIIDLTSVLMGPYATQIFADLGADVIKVESEQGDTTRALPPGREPGRGGMFLNLNRGKRSIVLNLKQPEAREALLRLCRDADVFVHSMRARAIERLGLSYENVRAANPRIIYASMYGYGRGGPYRDHPAYDDIVQAASGIVDLQARLSGGEPTYLANVVADKVSGLTGAYAITAALYAREKTGEGQEIEVPMFETMVSFCALEHLCGSVFRPPLGPPEYARAVSPSRRPYETADGHIGVMIYNDRHWRNFFDAIGNPDWSRDPVFATMESRSRNIDTVLARVAAVMKTRSTAEWVDLLREAQIPATAIASLDELLHDEHLDAVGFWHDRETDAGPLRMPGIPVQFSATPGEIGDPGPALGADTRAVLEEAGFASDEIDALIGHGAPRPAPAGQEGAA